MYWIHLFLNEACKAEGYWDSIKKEDACKLLITVKTKRPTAVLQIQQSLTSSSLAGEGDTKIDISQKSRCCIWSKNVHEQKVSNEVVQNRGSATIKEKSWNRWSCFHGDHQFTAHCMLHRDKKNPKTGTCFHWGLQCFTDAVGWGQRDEGLNDTLASSGWVKGFFIDNVLWKAFLIWVPFIPVLNKTHSCYKQLPETAWWSFTWWQANSQEVFALINSYSQILLLCFYLLAIKWASGPQITT